MNLEELRKKLIASARAHPPEDRVPYLFEKRVMARLLKHPVTNAGAQWAAALWRAAAPCVVIMLLLAAWSFFEPASARPPNTDLAQEIENTLLAGAYPDSPAPDSLR